MNLFCRLLCPLILVIFPAILSAQNKDGEFFKQLFQTNPGKFDSLLARLPGFNARVIYTMINREANGTAGLNQYYLNKSGDPYFNPGSAVKLAIAILALQKLNEINVPSVTMNTSMITETAYSGQTAQYNLANSIDGRPNISNYIKEMFLLDDNNAFNRLYEFLGQEYLNQQLIAKGYRSARIINRLGVNLSEDENRHTNPVSFYNSTGQVVYSQPAAYAKSIFVEKSKTTIKNIATDSLLLEHGVDSIFENRMNLDDLNQIMISLLFPEKIKKEQRFNITLVDRNFLLKALSQLPGETLYPAQVTQPDSSGKEAAFSADRNNRPGKDVRIFSASGSGKGHLTRVAYIIDTAKKIEFIIATTINCGSNHPANAKYDCDEIPRQFLKNLGEALYDYEIKRKRKYRPDLSGLIFTYDK